MRKGVKGKYCDPVVKTDEEFVSDCRNMFYKLSFNIFSDIPSNVNKYFIVS